MTTKMMTTAGVLTTLLALGAPTVSAQPEQQVNVLYNYDPSCKVDGRCFCGTVPIHILIRDLIREPDPLLPLPLPRLQWEQMRPHPKAD